MIPKCLENTTIGEFAKDYLDKLHELNLTPRQYNYVAEMLLRIFTDFNNVNDEIERNAQRVKNFIVLYNENNNEELLMTLLAASLVVFERPPLEALHLSKDNRDAFRFAFKLAKEELIQRLAKNSEDLGNCLKTHYPPLPEQIKDFSLN